MEQILETISEYPKATVAILIMATIVASWIVNTMLDWYTTAIWTGWNHAESKPNPVKQWHYSSAQSFYLAVLAYICFIGQLEELAYQMKDKIHYTGRVF